MEAKATARTVLIAPRKARLVIQVKVYVVIIQRQHGKIINYI